MVKYRWEVARSDPREVHRLQNHASLTRPSALVLASRGFTTQSVDDFLRPALQDLVDPYTLRGTRRAAERLWQAIQNNETILIHGDYDTDGITATALLTKVLSRNGARTEAFLPHRIDDGYGLTAESIEKACREHHSLLITVDCGITSAAAVDTARRLDIDVIVTDHHEPAEQLPDATAVIDPKLPGTDPRIVELAGVGVAFKVCHAFIKYGREHGLGGFETDLREILDLVALGTVADIVPLLHENRCLVRHGLKVLSRQHRPGIRALCELVGLNDSITAQDIAFRIAPRINASGRIGDPMLSMDLLMADSMTDAHQLAKSLDEQNSNRQQLEGETFADAERQIAERCNLDDDRTIMVWGERWHQGVLGIVAARLTRSYHRPSIVLTYDANGLWCGSGRSVTGINLVGMLERCQEHLTRFGGHPMAAGLSFEPARLEAFRRAFEATVRTQLPASAMRPCIEVSGDVMLSEIDEIFLEELTLLEPFGQGNPEPVLATRHVVPHRVNVVGRGHTRGSLSDEAGNSLGFIFFNRLPETLPEPPWDVAYRPQMNRFNGAGRPQAIVVDLKPAD